MTVCMRKESEQKRRDHKNDHELYEEAKRKVR